MEREQSSLKQGESEALSWSRRIEDFADVINGGILCLKKIVLSGEARGVTVYHPVRRHSVGALIISRSGKVCVGTQTFLNWNGDVSSLDTTSVGDTDLAGEGRGNITGGGRR